MFGDTMDWYNLSKEQTSQPFLNNLSTVSKVTTSATPKVTSGFDLGVLDMGVGLSVDLFKSISEGEDKANSLVSGIKTLAQNYNATRAQNVLQREAIADKAKKSHEVVAEAREIQPDEFAAAGNTTGGGELNKTQLKAINKLSETDTSIDTEAARSNKSIQISEDLAKAQAATAQQDFLDQLPWWRKFGGGDDAAKAYLKDMFGSSSIY